MVMTPSVMTVSQLAAILKDVVEENFLQVLVEGEISNFSSPSSGHCYFCLKDEGAQLRAVMFRSQYRLLPFRPENGMHVMCSGRLSLYQQRGEVQLIAETMTPAGVGSLQLAFEQLKTRLAAEGLFAEGRKRPLPPFPRVIGVVTSATGAAIHDILNVLRRRGAGLRVLLRPVRVQGNGSVLEIAAAIDDFNRHGEADVLIVGRGGGSLEDLWSFNEEAVARAIHGSVIPVISAVGHETDFTIADFVADLRAPTPSAAAEIVVKSRLELEKHVDHLTLRLVRQMQNEIEGLRQRVTSLNRSLRSPQQEIAWWRQREEDLRRRLQRAMTQRLRESSASLQQLSGQLETLSPLRTLERGYAIVFAATDGKVVQDAASLSPGDQISIQFSRGKAQAVVTGGGK
jgi:exodeoxyribonuclease VII large subunit